MSEAQHVQAIAKPASSFSMISRLGLVAMMSGFLIVLAFKSTEARIKDNNRRALEAAVFKVIPGAEQRVTFIVDTEASTLEKLEAEESDARKIYAGYNAEGELKGVAIPAEAQGYADAVKILYGYAPDKECVTGMKVLASKETPGLGDKIGKEKDPFQENFKALDVKLNAEKTAPLNLITTVKNGAKSNPWEIDGITGATISSKAIGKMLRESTQELLPLLVKEANMNKLKAGMQ
jgi:electron transport complex protein RnfG